MDKKILYLQGRPCSHPIHQRLAKALNVDVLYVDEKYRWHDKNFSTLKNLWFWLLNAFSYRKYNNYDVILVDGLHFSPVIAKKLRILKPNVKIMAHMGSHTLYFMYTNQFSYLSTLMQKKLLKSYDVFFCEGEMAKELILKMVPDTTTILKKTFLGPLQTRYDLLKNNEPDFESNHIITIASGPTKFRMYYKGLDIMIDAFTRARKHNTSLIFTIIGHWDDDNKKELLKDLSSDDINNIHFVGNTDDITSYFKNACLYLHISRGDAFPTSTIEAMHAGVPILMSEYTGTKEILKMVDGSLILPLIPEIISERIVCYMKSPKNYKIELSKKLKSAAQNYTEKNAILHYQKVFKEVFEN